MELLGIIGSDIETLPQKPRYMDFKFWLAYRFSLHYPYVHVLA